ncbi:V-set domain-containing T-cell activation inhibitor 1-like [Mixophyes fleayi]|uniref:V-set domain-containing T-cell activation inhibitor 1-like n=1 Tax=Mixophyes fleayi TaxID=3061075 RepID=UPI003F4E2D8C
MATPRQIIFRIMIVIIIFLIGAIALIIGLSVAGNSTTNDVTTVNAVNQIWDNVTLNCTFIPDVNQSSNILWEKDGQTGFVYKYENGKISLTGQNAVYNTRTSLFLNQLSAGNASLQITNVQLMDAGVYKCTVTNSKGSGQNKLSLDVGAFADVRVTNTSETTIHCHSPTWYPKPTVTWLNVTTGSDLTNLSTTTYSSITYEINSDFTGAVEDMGYRCVIQNNLARAEGDALFTASGFQTESRLQVLSSADVLSPSLLLLCLLILIVHPGAALW